MKKCVVVMCASVLPICLRAQSISNGTDLQSILDQLYREMMPLCGQLRGAAMLIGGFGALWYIASRVWKNIAAAEPIDLYGLLRPFVLGMCILLFPSVIDLINGIMQPTVIATNAMVKGQNAAMQQYLQMRGNNYLGTTGVLNPMNWVREVLRELLELLFQGVALIIDAIRTFYLIVLAIIGPIVFGLSIYDGFQHLITVWLARYVNVFLWLPVANIFGAIIAKIQERMALPDTSDNLLGNPLTFTDWAYLIFLLIGIIGYCTVPSVANYIVNAGGGNALLHKVTSMTMGAGKQAASVAATGMSADAFGGAANKMSNSMSDAGVSGNYFKDKLKGGNK